MVQGCGGPPELAVAGTVLPVRTERRSYCPLDLRHQQQPGMPQCSLCLSKECDAKACTADGRLPTRAACVNFAN